MTRKARATKIHYGSVVKRVADEDGKFIATLCGKTVFPKQTSSLSTDVTCQLCKNHEGKIQLRVGRPYYVG